MRDFTIETYKNLLIALKQYGYLFQTYEEFLNNPQHKVVILRHDVDRLPSNSLKIAVIEKEIGLKSSYYFRIVPETFNEKIISQIAGLGHEIGYHYEDLTIAGGNLERAYDLFCLHLGKCRELYPVTTICMHGSPLSRYDNRDIWRKYDYHSLGIIGEPYYDVDYSRVFYITDTGRMWNNHRANVRDIVNSPFEFRINSTFRLIKLIERGKLPDKIMINTHPQRWYNERIGWYKEFVGQNIKNIFKFIMLSGRNDSK